jgi:hypothetical protein
MSYTFMNMKKSSLALFLIIVGAQTAAQAETVASQYLAMSRQLIEQQGITINEGADKDSQLLVVGQETCKMKAKGLSDRAIISAVGEGTQQLQSAPSLGIALGKATLQAARETGYCETVQQDFIKVETVSAFLATSKRMMVERGMPPTEAQAVNETKLLQLGKKVCELRLQGRSVEKMKKVMITAATKASPSSSKQVAAYIVPAADAAQQELCPVP